jgi:hypothetical protein
MILMVMGLHSKAPLLMIFAAAAKAAAKAAAAQGSACFSHTPSATEGSRPLTWQHCCCCRHRLSRAADGGNCCCHICLCCCCCCCCRGSRAPPCCCCCCCWQLHCCSRVAMLPGPPGQQCPASIKAATHVIRHTSHVIRHARDGAPPAIILHHQRHDPAPAGPQQ